MSEHVSGKVTKTTTTSGRGLNKRTIVTTSETTDIPGVNINTTKTSRSTGEKIALGGNLLGLIACILLGVSLIKSLMGSSPITLGGLLETLASAPSVDMSMTTFNVLAPLQWDGVLSGLASFINFFITIFNVLIFAFKGIGQVVVYIIYFIKFLFA